MPRRQASGRLLGIWLVWSCAVAVVSWSGATTQTQTVLDGAGLTEGSLYELAYAGGDVRAIGSTDALLDEATRVYQQGGQESATTAIALLESAGQKDPLSVRRLYFLAQAYRKLQDLHTSAAYFERVIAQLDLENGSGSALDASVYAFWAHFEYAEVLANELVEKQLVQDHLVLDKYRRLAVEHYEEALQFEHKIGATRLEDRDLAGVHNTLGLLLLDLGNRQDAIDHFQQAIAVDSTRVEPHANLALVMYELGDAHAAVEWNTKVLSLSPNEPAVLHNTGLSLQLLGRDDESVEYWKRAHEQLPNATEPLCSLAGYYGGIGDTTTSVQYLYKASLVADQKLHKNPQQLGSRTESNSIRLQLAVARLPMLYQSTEEIRGVRSNFEVQLDELTRQTSFILPEALATTIGPGSMGYYAIYQGFNDVGVRSKLAEIYLKGAPFLGFTAPHVAHNRDKSYAFQPTMFHIKTQNPDNRSTTAILERRIRVGFISAFMRHHSVGLLTQGVISGLSRDRFEVVLLLYNHELHDEVTKRAQKAAETVVFLDNNNVRLAQQQVASLELDVLVFTEIGMHIDSYFLAFSRLALRTAVFWGHATTSGIPAADYFISSNLFLDPRGGENDQVRYSECVYHMQHLTTQFVRPIPVSELDNLRSGATMRNLLGLPSEQTMPVMMLVPQTLYKFHPDFDTLLGSTLKRIPRSFLVVLVGSTPLLKDQIMRRWRRVLSPDVYKRIYFVRRLESREFFELAAAAHVVLDPFPVGGGRSSFEIFAVGTPIVATVPRTSILQLTAGMYRAMGIDDGAGLAFNDAEFVEKTVALASNYSARQSLRKRILDNNYKLYDNPVVIGEWERFFTSILREMPPRDPTDGPARTADECPNFQHLESSSHPESDRNATSSAVASPAFFKMKVRFPGHATVNNETQAIVRMRRQDEDPFEVAKRFAESLSPPLDVLQTAFIAKLLWNAQHRLEQRVVAVWNATLSSSSMSEVSHNQQTVRIEVRDGDDLALTVRWQMLKAWSPGGLIPRNEQEEGTLNQLIGNAIAHIARLMPEHSSPEWIAARALLQAGPLAFDSRQEECDLPSRCVTLLITTCKRLVLFLRTLGSLQAALGISAGGTQWTDWFRRVLVLDDNSSPSDRETMVAQFPAFEFYFKKPDERGHARSLNMALALVDTPYVLYLEDDWEFARDPPVGLHVGFFLFQAMAILRASRRHDTSAGYLEPVVQVLLNDQHGGWPRLVQTTHGSIPYHVHEFATADSSHSFAYWPGFSLNPGVWDITALRHALSSADIVGGDSNGFWFNEKSSIFERLFSLRVWRQGLLVAYLTHDVVTHIGAPPGSNASAYVLNGFRRPFDG